LQLYGYAGRVVYDAEQFLAVVAQHSAGVPPPPDNIVIVAAGVTLPLIEAVDRIARFDVYGVVETVASGHVRVMPGGRVLSRLPPAWIDGEGDYPPEEAWIDGEGDSPQEKARTPQELQEIILEYYDDRTNPSLPPPLRLSGTAELLKLRRLARTAKGLKQAVDIIDDENLPWQQLMDICYTPDLPEAISRAVEAQVLGRIRGRRLAWQQLVDLCGIPSPSPAIGSIVNARIYEIQEGLVSWSELTNLLPIPDLPAVLRDAVREQVGTSFKGEPARIVVNQTQYDNVMDQGIEALPRPYASGGSPVVIIRASAIVINTHVPAIGPPGIIGTTVATVSGEAQVWATDTAEVHASGQAGVRADGRATVYASGNALVYPYDSATVYAAGQAEVYVKKEGKPHIIASGNARVQVDPHYAATVEASDTAYVQVRVGAGKTDVTASGNARVEANGSETVVTASEHALIKVLNKWVQVHSSGTGVKVAGAKVAGAKMPGANMLWVRQKEPETLQQVQGKATVHPDYPLEELMHLDWGKMNAWPEDK
jgi:hypothetical protein